MSEQAGCLYTEPGSCAQYLERLSAASLLPNTLRHLYIIKTSYSGGGFYLAFRQQLSGAEQPACLL